MQESILLNKCLQLIEEKTHWGFRSEWTNYHFTRLSEQISEETGIYISASTVKRLFRNNINEKPYTPQLETKNALAIYLGFKNWADFERNYNGKLFLEQQNSPSESENISLSLAPQKNKWFLVTLTIIIVVLFLLFISYLFIRSNNKFYIKWNEEKIQAPVTASFRYKIPKFHSGKYFIDFGDDQKIALAEDKESIGHFYKLPDYYNVKVFEEEKIIDSTRAYILSGGWIKGISTDNRKLYISKDFVKTKKDLIVHQSRLDSIGIDDQRFWVQYRNFEDFKISGDHFILETLVKNNSAEGGIDYNDIEIKLIGETGNIEVFFIRTGLTVWTKDIFSDKILDGKHQDLSAFGQDLSNWRKINFIVNDKKVKILFEGKSIFTTNYKKPIGKIKGVIYNFRGFGEAKYLKLWNEKEELVYDYQF